MRLIEEICSKGLSNFGAWAQVGRLLRGGTVKLLRLMDISP